MDDFGVLVQNYGIKPQGKLAPMASTKGGIRTQNSNSFHLDPAFSSRPSSRSSKSTHNWNSSNGSNLDDQADPFGFNFNGKAHNYGGLDGFDDVFQVPVKSSGPSNSGGNGGTMGFDLESMFMDSMNLNTRSGKNDRCGNEDYSDMFGGFSTSNAPISVENNDLLSSTPPGGDPIDDFFGNLRTTSFESRGSRENLDGNKGKVLDTDDMLPGFSSSNGRNERGQAATRLKKSVLSSIEELEDFATRMVPENANSHEDNYLEKDIFEFENKIKKRPNNNFQEINFMYIDEPDTKPTTAKKHNNSTGTVLDLDSFFNSHNQTKATSAGKDAASDIEKPEVVSSKTRPEAVPNLFFDGDDLSSIFGAGFSCGEFEEIEGESEERRAARLDRHRRTEKRMAQALADMNERELQAQQEQEERHRIAEALNIKMKSWAAGKEGNLRALLSSLQQVLDPECGWKPVSLTDLITSAQVKIVYKKAALFVHPDKVQQRGASLQQKYVAEKVFDILKEAWNKFNADELR